MNEVTEEMKEYAIDSGWSPEQVEKGYSIFTSNDVGNGATHIQRIDLLMKFDSDDEAAKYAEEVDGVKLIHDIQFEPVDPNYANYVDTPENRKLLYDIICENVKTKVSILYGNQIELPVIVNGVAKAIKPLGVNLSDDEILEMKMEDFIDLIDIHSGKKPKKTENEIKIPSEESDSVDSNIEKYIRTLLNDEKEDLEKKSKKSISKKTGYTVSSTINCTENGKNRIEEMVAVFNLLRTASSESEVLESMMKIKRSIGRSFLFTEDVVRALPDEDEDSIYGDWMEIAYRLRDAITEYVVYYRALLEKDLLTPGIQPPDLIDMKSSVLDIVVEVYTILGFLEAQLIHELEELMRSEGKIEKEQIQMRIRKTKIDLTNIRRQNISTEADITDALVEHRGATNYDIGTI